MSARRTDGRVLYARCRVVPGTLAALAVTGVLAAASARWLDPYLDQYGRLPAVALAPQFAASAVGVGLHVYAAELEAGAVRRWWPRRLAHLLAMTAVAAAVLAVAVPGDARFGAAQMARNLLGGVGLTALAAAVAGARLSWLPALAYLGCAYLAGGSVSGRTGGVAAWLAWPLQPGVTAPAWGTAGLLFAAGAAVFVAFGARRSPDRG